jgi:hypothetical protein
VTSPTARSLAHLRADGWHAEVVEQTVRAPGRTFKRDLWGFVDILCLRDGERLAVQTTSGTNVAARIRKIADSPLLPLVRSAGIAIHVHGWRRNAAGKWVLRIEDVS